MNIVGLDSLVFGVDDIDGCTTFLLDYGLESEGNGRFTALDGTSVVIRSRNDSSLPRPLETGNMLRKTVYGVADAATLDDIASELRRDREVCVLDDGSIEAQDDLGFVLGFQLTVRTPLALSAEVVNAPGSTVQRPVNSIGADPDAPVRLRTLSHVVYFVPDAARNEAFYRERLGFVTTDRFTDTGPFMRPAGMTDHHCLFFINTPAHLKGCQHFTFHVGGPNEVLLAGTRLLQKGYESFWGPGRHVFGSNWFWYFNSPMGVQIEYDADMDTHDDTWVAREVMSSADASQIFLFHACDKWLPGGGPGH